MYKTIYPCDFPRVDSLVDILENNELDLATQYQSGYEDFYHFKIMTLPLDWQTAQVNILEQQGYEEREKFVNHHLTRPAYVSFMKNAKFLGGGIVNSNMEINKDTSYHYFRRSIDFNNFLSLPEIFISEAVFFLGNMREHYHWIMDCLSGIKLWKEFGLDKKERLYVPNITDFKRQTLEVYGGAQLCNNRGRRRSC